MTSSKGIKLGIVQGMPDSEYHAIAEKESERFYSSSQLKDMLNDPEIFHGKYIAGTIKKENIPAFDIGRYFHTAILEPEKTGTDCAVYQGIRRGKKWEEFLAENEGKAIITETELAKANNLIEAVKASPIAMEVLSGGTPELSCFAEIHVSEFGHVFITDKAGEIRVLDLYRGWIPSYEGLKLGETITLRIKVRADYHAIQDGKACIADLKSTSGNVKNVYSIRNKIKEYYYDLSAALYLDIFNAALYRENVEVIPADKFYWIFASKDAPQCKTYLATPKMISVGRSKWKKAVNMLADHITRNWTFVDELDTLDPLPFEEEWLTNNQEPRGTRYGSTQKVTLISDIDVL